MKAGPQTHRDCGPGNLAGRRTSSFETTPGDDGVPSEKIAAREPCRNSPGSLGGEGALAEYAPGRVLGESLLLLVITFGLIGDIALRLLLNVSLKTDSTSLTRRFTWLPHCDVEDPHINHQL